jgi:hypothetical protein
MATGLLFAPYKPHLTACARKGKKEAAVISLWNWIPDDGGRPYCHVCKAPVSEFKYRPGLLVRDGSYAAVLEYEGDDVLVIRCHGQKWVMRRETRGRWCVDAVSEDRRASSLPTARVLSKLNRPRRIAGFLLHPRALFQRAKPKTRT